MRPVLALLLIVVGLSGCADHAAPLADPHQGPSASGGAQRPAACGGDSKGPDGSYALDRPEGWSKQPANATRADALYWFAVGDDWAMLTLARGPASDRTAASSINGSIDQVAAAAHDFHLDESEARDEGGLHEIRIAYSLTLDGKAAHMQEILLWRDGPTVVAALFEPAGMPADAHRAGLASLASVHLCEVPGASPA